MLIVSQIFVVNITLVYKLIWGQILPVSQLPVQCDINSNFQETLVYKHPSDPIPC